MGGCEVALLKFVGYVIFALLLSLPALAQTAILRGQVTDESGAIVPGARVELQGPSSLLKTTKAGNDGSYCLWRSDSR